MTRVNGKHWSSWRCALLLVLGCTFSGLVAAQEDFSGVVTQVLDGDTVIVKPRARKPVTVRISGVDAPESCQVGGVTAKAALVRRVDHRTVLVQSLGRDTYGRTLGYVLLNGDDLGAWLVSAGLAWNYRGPYAQEERQARTARRGVHAQRSAIRPSEFRQRNGACGSADAGSNYAPQSSSREMLLNDMTVGTTSVRSTDLASGFAGSTSSSRVTTRTWQEERDRRERLARLQQQARSNEQREQARQRQLQAARRAQQLRQQSIDSGLDQFDTQGYSSSTTTRRRAGSLNLGY